MDSIKVNTESRGRGIAVTELSVDSFTRPDTHYVVRLYEGGATCTCPAYRKGHRNPCKHILKVSGFNAKLADGRRCKVLDSLTMNLSRRAMGFDAGRHEVSLCELTDGTRVIESVHFSGRVQVRCARRNWREGLPFGGLDSRARRWSEVAA